MGTPAPVPAPRRIGRHALLRIGNDEAYLVGELVHARAGGEIVRILLAAMKHDDERARLPVAARGNVGLVAARAGTIAIARAHESARKTRSNWSRPSPQPPGKPSGEAHRGLDSVPGSPPPCEHVYV